jgi:hypothetical protein
MDEPYHIEDIPVFCVYNQLIQHSHSELLDFFTLASSSVQKTKEHVSETGSVAVLRWGGGGVSYWGWLFLRDPIE